MCMVIMEEHLTMQYIPIALELKLKNSLETKQTNIITNIYRIQAYNSIIFRYFCIDFVDFMLKSENLLDSKKLFYSNA